MEDKSSDDIKEQWTRCGDVGRHMQHRNIIASGNWLDDLIISAAQNSLEQQFPYIDGLLNPSEKLAMEFIQIFNVNRNHRVTISTIGCTSSTISVWQLSREVTETQDEGGGQSTLCILQCKNKNIRVIYENVQKQYGESDCGCFAVIFATSLCYGKTVRATGNRQWGST